MLVALGFYVLWPFTRKGPHDHHKHPSTTTHFYLWPTLHNLSQKATLVMASSVNLMWKLSKDRNSLTKGWKLLYLWIFLHAQLFHIIFTEKIITSYFLQQWVSDFSFLSYFFIIFCQKWKRKLTFLYIMYFIKFLIKS